MDENVPTSVTIDYDPEQITGTLSVPEASRHKIWARIRQSATSKDSYRFSENSVTLPWPSILSLIREFAPQQKKQNFRFKPSLRAKLEVERFVAQYRTVKQAQTVPPQELSASEITQKLEKMGFTSTRVAAFSIARPKASVSATEWREFFSTRFR